MPDRLIGPQVVRGTICRDKWRVDVRVVCSDRVPERAASPMLVEVRWRAQEGEDLPPRPDDSGPVALTLRKRSEAGHGMIRFDGDAGPASMSFTADTRRLLTLWGESATVGSEPDVLLDLAVEGKVEASLPLAVGPLPAVVAIRGATAADPPPEGLAPGRAARVTAVVEGPPVPGSFRWFAAEPELLEVRGDAAAQSVELMARGGTGAQPTVFVFFAPEGDGPGVLASRRFTVSDLLSYRGRVVDQIGEPVAEARVEAVGPDGEMLGGTTTLEGGSWALVIDQVPAWTLALSRGEARAAYPQRPTLEELTSARDLGDSVLRLPVALEGTVGADGDNLPRDVRRLQDRLQELGRLGAADVAAEPVDTAAAGPVNLLAMPRLYGALHSQLMLSLGIPFPLALIRAADPVLAAMNGSLPFPPVRLALTAPVGELPGASPAPAAINRPADVRAVQERLLQVGFLPEAGYLAERVDPAAVPVVASVPAARLARTLAAIREFDRLVVQGSLRAVIPGRRNAQLLDEPYLFGLLPLRLRFPVGVGAPNHPADVRAVQDRLLRLGALAPAGHQAEAVAVPDPDATPPPAPVAETALTATLAALASFRQQRLGVAAAAGVAELEEPTLERLNHPPRLALVDAVGEPAGTPPVPAPNRAADVRALQDRLRFLGFLAEADHLRERVNPVTPPPVALAPASATVAAIRAFRQQVLGDPAPAAGTVPPPVRIGPADRPPALSLTGPVGAGKTNARADLRAVQDRLKALRFLSATDHARELVDPARTGPVAEADLASTFAALGALRRQVLRHPAAAAGQAWTAQGVVEPDDDTHRLLSNPLSWGRDPVALTGSVGFMGWNRPADVRAVQDRLLRFAVLTSAHHGTEQANPALTDRVAETALVETVAAVRRFREAFLGAAAPALARIEPAHPTLAALDNPLFALSQPIVLAGSVGAGGANARAEVRTVQDRLRDLRWLAEGDHRTEAAAVAAGGAAVADAVIPRTIAAVRSFQERVMGATVPAGGRIDPLDEANRLLAKPFLPPAVQIGLTGSVGAGAARNSAPDVRTVQTRLHRLGYLDTATFLTEQAAAAGAGNVAVAAIPGTVAAVRRFQRTASGGTDGILSTGGAGERTLGDPTFTTPSTTNPHTDLREAGPAMPAFAHAVQQIITAIEAHEAGGSTGEVPALLRNGSRTPASFGKAQMIGGTAVET
ncbi:MAG TPA: hypothetical protein VF263_16665, partial [Longimicrobiaceae bacterium]